MTLPLLAHEVGRELGRRATWLLLAGALGFAALWVLATAEELQFYWLMVYTFLPLGMAPLAARVVVRDRERGMAPLLALTRLTPAAALAAKAIALALFLVAAVALTLPAMAVVVSRSGPLALPMSLVWPLWGFLVGIVALAAGLLVGVLAGRRATAAVSAAFLLVLAWVSVGESAREWVAMADAEATRRFALWAAHLSPVTWSHDVTDGFGHGIRTAPGSLPAEAGALLMAAVLLAVGAVVALRLQHVDEWRRPLSRRVGALALVVLLLAGWGAATAAAWTFELPEDRVSGRRVSPDGSYAVAVSGLSRASREGWPWDFRDGDVLELRLNLESTPGRTLEVRDVALASPHYRFEPLENGPWTATTATAGPPAGTATVVVPFRVTILYEATRSPLLVSATVDGTPFTLTSGVFGNRAEVPVAPAFAVALLPVAGAAAAAWFVPRRLAAW